MSAAVSESVILDALKHRYATKKFDASKKIPAATLAALEEALVLAPSSYGLQPWKFVVVSNPEVRAKLKPVSWNQPQITDASHLVVLAIKKDLGEKDIEAFIKRISEVRGAPVESLKGYKEMMVGSVVNGPIHPVVNLWAQKQTYIALGTLLVAAAALGVDACPMEGFDPAQYDAILGLDKLGLGATVLCALGYRAADDAYASLAKVRFDKKDVIVHV